MSMLTGRKDTKTSATYMRCPGDRGMTWKSLGINTVLNSPLQSQFITTSASISITVQHNNPFLSTSLDNSTSTPHPPSKWSRSPPSPLPPSLSSARPSPPPTAPSASSTAATRCSAMASSTSLSHSPATSLVLTFPHRCQLPALGAPHHRRPRPPQPARRQRAQDADALLLQRPRHRFVRRVLLLQHAAHVPLPAAVGQRMRKRQQQE